MPRHCLDGRANGTADAVRRRADLGCGIASVRVRGSRTPRSPQSHTCVSHPPETQGLRPEHSGCTPSRLVVSCSSDSVRAPISSSKSCIVNVLTLYVEVAHWSMDVQPSNVRRRTRHAHDRSNRPNRTQAHAHRKSRYIPPHYHSPPIPEIAPRTHRCCSTIPQDDAAREALRARLMGHGV